MSRVGFHMRMDQKLHASVMKVADDLGVSMNEFITTILSDFVNLDEEMYIVRLHVRRDSNGDISMFELKGPKELHDIQDGKGMVD